MILAATLSLALALLPLPQQPDLVVFLSDDVGLADQQEVSEDLAALGLPSRIEELAAAGMRFPQCRAAPYCSPTRRMLQDGRWRFSDTGLTCGPTLPSTMPLATLTIAEVAKLSGYTTGYFGKWHVGPNPDPAGRWEDTPAQHGYDHAAWTPGNMNECMASGYTSWPLVMNGTATFKSSYAPEKIEQEFAAWWAATPSPKFAVFAPNWAHGPFGFPPANMLPPGWPTVGAARPKYLSMCAGIDAQVGRIRDLVVPTGVLAYLSDNGTPANVSPLDPGNNLFPFPAKGTTFERGIRVELILAGLGVPVGTSPRLASPVDLYPTLCGLMGAVVPSGLPGEDLLQPATRNYTLSGSAIGGSFDDMCAVGRWPGRLFKLRARGAPGAITWTLYDLIADPNQYHPRDPGMYPTVSNYLALKLLPEMPL